MGRARGGEMGNREGEERGIMKRVEAQQRAGETAQREGGGERGEERGRWGECEGKEVGEEL